MHVTNDIRRSIDIKHKAEFDSGTRGKNYRLANDRMPDVRYLEFLQMFHKISPSSGQIIVECGSGNGFLTIPLAKAVGPLGRVYTLDDSLSNLNAVREKSLSLGLHNIVFIHLDDNYFQTGFFPLESELADSIATLATFHHYDEKKEAALREFKRILKPNGKVIIADVAQNTKTQAYFDDFVHHICSTGHDHRFLDRQSLEKISFNSGFKMVDWQKIYVPWQFTNTDQMGNFLHTIHDATCSMEESIEAAIRYLGINYFDKQILLHWELFFATLRVF